MTAHSADWASGAGAAATKGAMDAMITAKKVDESILFRAVDGGLMVDEDVVMSEAWSECRKGNSE